jgi:SAM-dependent methyltransferase
VNSKKRKVLIGAVAFDGILPEAQQAAIKAFYDLGKYHSGNYEFYFEIVRKREQFRAKNHLTHVALKLGCEFMWQIDDDTVLKPDTFEVLMRMLDGNKDAGIAGCLYSHKGADQHPVVMWVEMSPLGNALADYYQFHELTGDVMEVGVIGGGCMLFRMAAFEDMMEPYFWNEADMGTDMQICMRMATEGWKVLCDTGHEVGHVGERKVWYPSLADDGMAEMRKFNERLYNDLLNFLGINGDEYRRLIVRSTMSFQEKWLEFKPETPEEIAAIYGVDSHQDAIVARNVYYNSKHRQAWVEFSKWLKKNVKNGATGLDYGCGVGIATQIMATHGVKTTSIDLDTDVVDFLEWRGKKHDFIDNVEVIRMSMDRPDGREYLPDRNFDVIVVKDVLEHLTNPEEVLVELLSRLNPMGILVSNAHIAEFKTAEDGQPQHLDLLDRERFAELCLEHGVVPMYGHLLRKEY